MELRKRFDSKKVFIALYFIAFAVYIIIGLQPAQASNLEISGEVVIPRISLKSDVATLELNNNKLDTPDTIVGSYSRARNKTLLIGHSTTVFSDLHLVSLGDEIRYNNVSYWVDKIETLTKKEVSMSRLLKGSDVDTLVIMTCAGELLGGGDATHRLIVTASIR